MSSPSQEDDFDVGSCTMGKDKPCDCGSGEPSQWELDGRRIPLVRACPQCREEKLSKFNPVIFGHYDESDVGCAVEPEDYY